jgi:hypothetical protein
MFENRKRGECCLCRNLNSSRVVEGSDRIDPEAAEAMEWIDAEGKRKVANFHYNRIFCEAGKKTGTNSVCDMENVKLFRKRK